MTSESHRTLFSSCLQPTACSLRSKAASGLSLIEILIAIGILAVSMMLIAAAFPAGVVMSIAVSDETTSQEVFQKALAEIKDKVSRADITPDTDNPLIVLDDNTLGTTDEILASRRLSETSPFSWAALIRPVEDDSLPPITLMETLCQVIIVVSRQPTGNPKFVDEAGNPDKDIPELRKVNCTASDKNARTITVDPTNFNLLVPSSGYIIDSQTGTVYSIISRNNNNTVTVLSTPPDDVQSDPRDFWLIPGPYDGTNYGQSSPAIRVFQAMLYLP